ncbi:MAG: YggS family pyridoxal phosphate-dependent enzyme [bacterium]|nr:YggS family pyridoxal phosphate-dependent enzyme [bacterium]
MSTGVPERLASVENRIVAACERAGRDPAEITLLGAAKRQTGDRIKAAYEAGLRNFGENIVQEALAHSRLLTGPAVTWHLIGPLQSNKVRKAVEIFDWIHSVDRLKIARRLDREASATGKSIRGLLEVNLGDESTKHGFAVAELDHVVADLRSLEHLSISGLMAIPPVSSTEAEARRWFRQLRMLRDRLFQGEASLSMGMSGDFEIAIEEGATHVRIGSALFGPRAERPAPQDRTPEIGD